MEQKTKIEILIEKAVKEAVAEALAPFHEQMVNLSAGVNEVVKNGLIQ